MEIITGADELVAALMPSHAMGRTVGLVPTMGALHAGHLSLVERSKGDNDVTVVSVFVNPTQFNDASDLAAYPRTAEADAALLEAAGADIVFMPGVEDVYPPDDDELRDRRFRLGAVAEVMEGAMRPGHFDGVAQVVSRLFDLVEPTRAYFGEKDYQQIAVVRAMAADGGYTAAGLELVACPIVRGSDGLALSSRNARLSADERAAAPAIHRCMSEGCGRAGELDPRGLEQAVADAIAAAAPGVLRPEYVAVVDAATLQPAADWSRPARMCAAVWCGPVRLIDNMACGPEN